MRALKRRWTLGGLMFLVAVAALPLVLYDRYQRARRAEAAAQYRRAREAIDAMVKQLGDAETTQPGSNGQGVGGPRE
jgi:cytochrome c-type biogenesis protein CcmH/NrfG